jgi:hypothetical protein
VCKHGIAPIQELTLILVLSIVLSIVLFYLLPKLPLFRVWLLTAASCRRALQFIILPSRRAACTAGPAAMQEAGLCHQITICDQVLRA